MTDERKHLREHIAEILRQAETDAGERVFSADAQAFRQADLPAIMVTIGRVSTDRVSVDPVAYLVTFHVEIDLVVDQRFDDEKQAVSTKEDDLDRLSQQVESALLMDPTLRGAARDSKLGSSEIFFADGGESELAAEAKQLDVQIYVVPTMGDAAELDPLKTADVRLDVPGGETTTLTSPGWDARSVVTINE